MVFDEKKFQEWFKGTTTNFHNEIEPPTHLCCAKYGFTQAEHEFAERDVKLRELLNFEVEVYESHEGGELDEAILSLKDWNKILENIGKALVLLGEKEVEGK
jgi:hypothetical protein